MTRARARRACPTPAEVQRRKSGPGPTPGGGRRLRPGDSGGGLGCRQGVVERGHGGAVARRIASRPCLFGVAPGPAHGRRRGLCRIGHGGEIELQPGVNFLGEPPGIEEFVLGGNGAEGLGVSQRQPLRDGYL